MLFDVFIPVVAVAFSIDLVGDKVLFSTLSFWVSRTVRKKKLCQDKSKKNITLKFKRIWILRYQ